MNELLKLIFITLLIYIFDILIYGSLVGLLYMIAEWSFTLNMYAKGVITYFVINALQASWIIWYKQVEEEMKFTRNGG